MPAFKNPDTGVEMILSVHRVTGLPIVASMCGGIAGFYERVKRAPVPLVGRALKAAEATAEWAVVQAHPMALKFKGPITYIDTLACKGLNALEDSAPVVKKAPDQILADAKAYISDKARAPVDVVTRVKDIGVAKAYAVREFGLYKLVQAAKSAYAQRALQNIQSCVTAVDFYVDKYIPAEGSEDEDLAGFEPGEQENWYSAVTPIAHAAAVTNKIRRRFYKLTLAKAQAAQKKFDDALMDDPTDGMLDYVHAQLTSGSQAVADAVNRIWQGTANLTPGKAAEAITAGLNVFETRTAMAARALFRFLTLSYNREDPTGDAAPVKVERKELVNKKVDKHRD